MLILIFVCLRFSPQVVRQPLQRGDRLYSSESDVCRRQILTTKVDPRTLRAKLLAVNP